MRGYIFIYYFRFEFDRGFEVLGHKFYVLKFGRKNNMFELTTGAVAQTMTTTEIASLTGKSKGNIHRDIKEQLLLGLYGIEDSNLNLLDIKMILSFYSLQEV